MWIPSDNVVRPSELWPIIMGDTVSPALEKCVELTDDCNDLCITFVVGRGGVELTVHMAFQVGQFTVRIKQVKNIGGSEIMIGVMVSRVLDAIIEKLFQRRGRDGL